MAKQITAGEIAFSQSNIYTSKDFPHYNPDTLIGAKGPAVYARMMLDDQVKSLMRFKQYSIVGRDYYFKNTAEGGTPEYDRQAEIADFMMDMIDAMKGEWSAKLVGLLSALENGYSISEKVNATTEIKGRPAWVVADIKLKPFETFIFESDRFNNIVALKQNGNDKPIPIDKVIHFVYQPDFDELYGCSDLRAAYRAYWSKDVVIKFQNIHLERHATGFPYIITKATPDDGVMAKLKSFLNNISSRTSAVLPGNLIEKFEQFQPISTDAYEKAIAMYDKAITKALLTPNLLGLSEQVNTGSYSQSQTQFEVYMMVIEFIGKSLADTLNEQLFRQVAEWNFGPGPMPVFCFNFESAAKKTELAKTWADLLQKGAIDKTPADEVWLRQIVGAPEVDVEDGQKDEEPPDDQDGTEDLPADDEDVGGADEPEAMVKPYADRSHMRRVDFQLLKRTFVKREQDAIESLITATKPIKQRLMDQVAAIVGEKAPRALDPARVEQIEVPKSQKAGINKALRKSLLETTKAAEADARQELPKAMKTNPRLVAVGMDKDQVDKILSSLAMRATNDLTRAVENAVRQELINGIRYDKTLKDIMQAIEENTDIVACLPVLDSAGRVVNIPARLETIARTNTAAAINESRQSLFSDPDLNGFVVAYEYSAILDDRVSDICESLDGRIQKDWGAYTPPNHFNCRSVLIPVTEVDDWDGKESKIPANVEPQKGFM